MTIVPADFPPIEIPFNKPFLTGAELAYIAEAVRLGHTAGDGPFTRRAQGLIESIVGTPSALLTTSCTHALEMAAILLELQPGDEVIVPSFTFVSTANAFALRGAVPVFSDIRPDTLNIDESRLEALITPRTRLIAVVHYAGVGCEMDVIMPIASRHNLAVVEDNAHGFLGTYRGRALGTFGSMATLSFHETKNITCGEGGALLVNDPALIARAEIVREKGDEPGPLLPRTSRQILVGRYRVELCSERHPGRLSRSPTGVARGHSAAAGAHLEPLQRPALRLGSCERSHSSVRPSTLPAAVPHVLSADAELRVASGSDRTPPPRRHPCGLPLHPAAQFRDGYAIPRI